MAGMASTDGVERSLNYPAICADVASKNQTTPLVPFLGLPAQAANDRQHYPRLRCDRQLPCSTCSSRALACTYAENHTTLPPLPKSAAMHDRIVHLERLVMSLIPGAVQNTGPAPTSTPGPAPNSGPTPPESTPGPPSQVSQAVVTPAEPALSATGTINLLDVRSECGSMHVSASELRYVGGDHWAAILDGIADLKDHLDQEEQLRLAREEHDAIIGDDANKPSLAPHALLLYGCRLLTSRDDVLAALPPKSAVDRYISRYFNRLDLVHRQSISFPFLKTY